MVHKSRELVVERDSEGGIAGICERANIGGNILYGTLEEAIYFTKT